MTCSEIVYDRVQPVQLSRKIGMADVFAVGAINRSERQFTQRRRNEPCPEILLSRQALFPDNRGFATEDGHTVPSLLSVHNSIVPRRLQVSVREIHVVYLKLLKSHDVWLASAQPVK